jgi:hypothetical protein
MRQVRRQSSQVFEDRRDGLPEALSLSAAPGFHHDDLGMVPAFNMLGRGNRLHGKGFGMMQNLVDPNAGWGYALQCSPTVRAGGKVFGGLPILPDKTEDYKAIDRRRRLTENGLSSVDLESRFYAVLSKAAQVA